MSEGLILDTVEADEGGDLLICVGHDPFICPEECPHGKPHKQVYHCRRPMMCVSRERQEVVECVVASRVEIGKQA